MNHVATILVLPTTAKFHWVRPWRVTLVDAHGTELTHEDYTTEDEARTVAAIAAQLHGVDHHAGRTE